MAFNLFKVGAIDRESLLDLVEPPMKQLLKEKLAKREKMEQNLPRENPKEKTPKKEPEVG
jgi:hypothetical protein